MTDVRFGVSLESFWGYQHDPIIAPKVGPKIDPKMMRTKDPVFQYFSKSTHDSARSNLFITPLPDLPAVFSIYLMKRPAALRKLRQRFPSSADL